MLSKEALNQYYEELAYGQKPNPHIISGTYIVAQSGGINNAREHRALTIGGDVSFTLPSQPGYNFYIDNLSFENMFPGSAGSTPTFENHFYFKINEPNSYTFIPALKDAATKILKRDLANKLITEDEVNPLRDMKYMIGIKFYGYDVDGKMLPANQVDPDSKDSSNGITNSYALYERFYPIEITELTYKLNGDNIVVYDVKAISYPIYAAYSEVNNTIPNKVNVAGSTVGETFDALTKALNNIQRTQKDNNNREVANIYKI